MEKFKRRFTDKDLEQLSTFLQDNAWGSPNVDANVPTKTQMKRNEIKLVGDDLYIKFPDGTVKKFSGTDIS